MNIAPDNDQKADRIAISGGEVAGAELLREGKNEAADRRAGYASEPAENHDGEGFRARRDRPWWARQGTPARATRRPRRQAPSQWRRSPCRCRDVDTHQRGRVAILESRPHRLSELRLVDHDVGRSDKAERHREDEDAQVGDRHRADNEGHLRKGRDHGLRDTAPGQHLSVLHNDPGANHHQHGRVDVGAAHGPQEYELDHGPNHHPAEDRQEQREEEVDPKQHGEREHRIGAEGVELPMGEVHHPHDAEDQGQPDP